MMAASVDRHTIARSSKQPSLFLIMLGLTIARFASAVPAGHEIAGRARARPTGEAPIRWRFRGGAASGEGKPCSCRYGRSIVTRRPTSRIGIGPAR